MSVDFRRLEPVELCLTPERVFERPKKGGWCSVSTSPQGEIYATYVCDDGASEILDEDNEVVDLQRPGKNPRSGRSDFDFPIVQRFDDGRWLVVEARVHGYSDNAFVFECDGRLIRSFHVGDGIETLLIDRAGKLWIGYFDEGVYGDIERSRFGPGGLVRLDDWGVIEFVWNERFKGEPFVADIYALTIDYRGCVWLCPYSEWPVASIEEDLTIRFPLDRSPVSGSDAMCVGPTHMAFFCDYQSKSRVTVVERATERVRTVNLVNPTNAPLDLVCVSTRGTSIAGVDSDNGLYKFDLYLLLAVLGTWTDGNSSTVESAVASLGD